MSQNSQREHTCKHSYFFKPWSVFSALQFCCMISAIAVFRIVGREIIGEAWWSFLIKSYSGGSTDVFVLWLCLLNKTIFSLKSTPTTIQTHSYTHLKMSRYWAHETKYVFLCILCFCVSVFLSQLTPIVCGLSGGSWVPSIPVTVLSVHMFVVMVQYTCVLPRMKYAYRYVQPHVIGNC